MNIFMHVVISGGLEGRRSIDMCGLNVLQSDKLVCSSGMLTVYILIKVFYIYFLSKPLLYRETVLTSTHNLSCMVFS